MLLDVSGRSLARRTVEGVSGAVVVRFDAGALAPGVYLARATRADEAADCRVILVR